MARSPLGTLSPHIARPGVANPVAANPAIVVPVPHPTVPGAVVPGVAHLAAIPTAPPHAPVPGNRLVAAVKAAIGIRAAQNVAARKAVMIGKSTHGAAPFLK